MAVEFQPPLFDQGMAWDYYAPRSSAASGAFHPPRLDVHHEHYHLLDSTALQHHARVFLLRRSLPEDAGVMLELRERYPVEGVRNWGDGLWVHTFERAPSH